MKVGLVITLFSLFFFNQLTAQQRCSTSDYQQEQLSRNPSLLDRINAIELFTKQQSESNIANRTEGAVIKIPVVVHILYHTQTEKISDARVASQIEIGRAHV